MPSIILASKSKIRKAFLKSLGISFKVVVSDFNEKRVKEKNHGRRAKKIALGKAEAVAKKNQGIIISADTFTVCKNKVLGKPKNIRQAIDMLKFLSSRKGVSYTGFCFFQTEKNIKFCDLAVTKIRFRKLGEREIDFFVNKYPVTEWAAAFALTDSYLLSLIDKISGSLTGLTHGLPTEFLIPLLRKEGVSVRSNTPS